LAAVEDGQQHLFMVAHERDDRAVLAQGDNLVKDALAVRSPVDVVAQEDERIVVPIDLSVGRARNVEVDAKD
jgi:hypothetical protein